MVADPAKLETPEQVYHPNLRPQDGDSGPACYQDQYRVCGPDCMAYLAQVPAGTTYTGEQWAHCLVLVTQERSARHLVVIADVLGRHSAFVRGAKAEAMRNERAPGVL